MEQSIIERVAVVETKVGALEDMAEKVDTIYTYIITEQANRKLRNRFYAGIAGFAAFIGTLVEIFGPFTKKS